jgi:hypothetical protein
MRVVLPSFRQFEFVTNGKPPTHDYQILKEYYEIISYTASSQNDDPIFLELAKEINGFVLSNDKFEDREFVQNIELNNFNYLYKYYNFNYF